MQITHAVRHLLSLVTKEDPNTFESIQLQDLQDMEVKFELNIMVFQLIEKEDRQVVAQIVQRSHLRYADAMYLNLHENHFSLITNLDKYCKCYECRQCQKLWKGAVPEHMKDYFSEMTPIFKNTKVCQDDIGEAMKKYSEQNKLMSQPRRTLIGSYYGEKILLATPLLQWYLEHGLVVTKIYQVVHYWPEDCFKKFGEEVSQAR